MTTNGSQIINSERKQKVTEGINTILSLFALVKQQRLFPRKIMTKATRGQVTVNSVEEMIKKFEEAKFEDCRINAYPSFLNEAEEKDYEKGVNLDLFTPNILFIDLDEKGFSSKQELDKIVNKILKHISKILIDSNHLLIWSGRGYHIIIPVQQTEALEHFEDFEGLTKRPSEELLKFANDHLSFYKADKANNPAFKSCLLRVPHTFNFKCFGEDKDPEVKIILEHDFSKPLPKPDNLLVEYMTFLADKKLKSEVENERRKRIQNRFRMNNKLSNKIPYIEKLLTIGIEDYRKSAISLIIVPYFATVLRLPDGESYHRARDWIQKCYTLKPLEPSISFFENLIKYEINRVKRTGIRPLKFKDTLQYKNKELYKLLYSLNY
ncbi:hypothetical protein BH23THE1_BH23THE1_28340 [soil metagenome]